MKNRWEYCGSPSYRINMQNLVRQEVILSAETVVIKIGTNVLSRPDETLDVDRLADLAEQIHAIHQVGKKVVVVSSGAVGAGIGLLGLSGRPKDLPQLQAAASAGQALLIRQYDDCLSQHGYHAAQILLTANDFKSRQRYLNVRNTINTLFEFGAVPIVNENDTVSIQEICFTDNDQLAAMVTNLVSSPLLVVLTTVDGLYDGDPDHADSRVIPLVDSWDDSLMELVADKRSAFGRGGMSAKLEAIGRANSVGENVIMANGLRDGVLTSILHGEEVGTLFLASGPLMPAWKRWIGFTVNPRGSLTLDDGAIRAISTSGRSLLPIGIHGVRGAFEKGELLSLADMAGNEVARGLSNYTSEDVRAIAGHRTDAATQQLGRLPYAEVVHRDNLVVLPASALAK